MIKRVISAIILIPLAIACIFYAPLWLLKFIILFICLISYFEWSSFTQLRERYLYFVLALIFLSVALFASNYAFIALMVVFLIHMIIGFKDIEKNRVLSQYYLFGGIVYVSLYIFFVMLMELEKGRSLFFLVCVSIWVGDSFAYFCGKSW